MTQYHLWPQETTFANGAVKTGYILEKSKNERIAISYQLPEHYADYLSTSCDPYTLEALFSAMRGPADLIVHGQVSPSLLVNLEELQSVWKCWKPERYNQIQILADREIEPTLGDRVLAVMAFSGGVDSCFTAWRHRMGKAGRRRCYLDGGVFIHGFDIPLNQQQTFERAAGNAQIMLESLGMKMIPVIHNSKYLGDDNEDNHAAVLVSCLMLLQNHYSIGLIASSVSYTNLLEGWQLPFGSTPITDWMLSSSGFSVIEDGAGYTRIDKVEEISHWPEAMQHLRVCLSRVGKERDRNCCRCEKCARNILAFRALRLGLPSCFEQDVSNFQILNLLYPNNVRTFYVDTLIKAAQKYKMRGFWLIALRLNLLINQFKIAIRSIGIRKHINSSKRLLRAILPGKKPVTG